MPHLPPGSVDDGSVTVWLPWTQRAAKGKKLPRLFTKRPNGQRKESVRDDSGKAIDVVLNGYHLDGYRLYLIEVQDEEGKLQRIVPKARARINFYFATDADLESAGIPRKGPAREKAILGLNKEKWALSPKKH